MAAGFFVPPQNRAPLDRITDCRETISFILASEQILKFRIPFDKFCHVRAGGHDLPTSRTGISQSPTHELLRPTLPPQFRWHQRMREDHPPVRKQVVTNRQVTINGYCVAVRRDMVQNFRHRHNLK